MNLQRHLAAGLLLTALAATSLPASAGILGKKKKEVESPGLKPTAAQNALIDKSIVRERAVTKLLKERTPLVETYIQNMKPDPILLQEPESDQHFLGRVEFGRIIGDDAYKANAGNAKDQGKKGKLSFMHSMNFTSGLSSSLRLTFHESGFVQMILMDSNDYDRQHYNFAFVRNDFLGTVPTAVFDVTPVGGKNAYGRFFGRIWVEARNGNVVRFNGDFGGTEETRKEFYHFDSWRTNVQPDLWLPTSVYIEESDPRSRTNSLKFKAINHIWGYSLKDSPGYGREHLARSSRRDRRLERCRRTSARSEPSAPGFSRPRTTSSTASCQAGLLDAPSDFDKTLEALANNILVYNGITTSSPIRVPHPAHRAAREPRHRQHDRPLEEPASIPPPSSPPTEPSRRRT